MGTIPASLVDLGSNFEQMGVSNPRTDTEYDMGFHCSREFGQGVCEILREESNIEVYFNIGAGPYASTFDCILRLKNTPVRVGFLAKFLYVPYTTERGMADHIKAQFHNKLGDLVWKKNS